MHRLKYRINFRHNFFTWPNFEYQIGRNQFNDIEFRVEFGDKKNFRTISWEFEIGIFYFHYSGHQRKAHPKFAKVRCVFPMII